MHLRQRQPNGGLAPPDDPGRVPACEPARLEATFNRSSYKGATNASEVTMSQAAATALGPAECALEPVRPTVDEAHKIMQAHLRCNSKVCQHRMMALAVLVDAGRYVLP
jgi:hypothetical protein